MSTVHSRGPDSEGTTTIGQREIVPRENYEISLFLAIIQSKREEKEKKEKGEEVSRPVLRRPNIYIYMLPFIDKLRQVLRVKHVFS